MYFGNEKFPHGIHLVGFAPVNCKLLGLNEGYNRTFKRGSLS